MKLTIRIRIHQIVFLLSVVGLCWLGMMAVHELGHVIGALSSGGRINRVVLHPAAISRTDVQPNPAPVFVVWAGPLLGSLLPFAGLLFLRRSSFCRSLGIFFAGFCLISNGAYIGLGCIEGIGDAGEMLRQGTPVELMLLFGCCAMAWGLWLWHRLGSLNTLVSPPNDGIPDDRMQWRARAAASAFGVVILIECLLSPKS